MDESSDLLEKSKRLIISIIVLGIAGLATFSKDVDPSNTQTWLAMAGMIVAYYLGSKKLQGDEGNGV